MPLQLDPFRVLSERERAAQLGAFDRWQARLGGDVDLRRGRLPLRESRFRALVADRPVWRGALDRDGFARALDGASPAPHDPRIVWLLALAKSSRGEAYGAEGELARFAARGFERVDRRQLGIVLEEGYHTRALREACSVLGIELKLRPPPVGMRTAIHAMQGLPDGVRYVPILCGEALGTLVFALLRDTTRLFASEPEVHERLHALLAEVARDEILHVVYCRARMSPLSLRLARRLTPLVVGALLRDVPELVRLGGGRGEFVRRVRSGIALPSTLAEFADAPAPAGASGVAAPQPLR